MRIRCCRTWIWNITTIRELVDCSEYAIPRRDRPQQQVGEARGERACNLSLKMRMIWINCIIVHYSSHILVAHRDALLEHWLLPASGGWQDIQRGCHVASAFGTLLHCALHNQLCDHLLRILDRSVRLLEALFGRHNGHIDTTSSYLSAGRWCNGSLAYGRVLWEGESRWRGLLPAMEHGEWLDLYLSLSFLRIFNGCVLFQVLRDNTKMTYDWSYIVAWTGIGTCLLAAILLSGAAVCLRNEREKEEQLNLQYLMPGKLPANGSFTRVWAHCCNLLVCLQSTRRSSRRIHPTPTTPSLRSIRVPTTMAPNTDRIIIRDRSQWSNNEMHDERSTQANWRKPLKQYRLEITNHKRQERASYVLKCGVRSNVSRLQLFALTVKCKWMAKNLKLQMRNEKREREWKRERDRCLPQ